AHRDRGHAHQQLAARRGTRRSGRLFHRRARPLDPRRTGDAMTGDAMTGTPASAARALGADAAAATELADAAGALLLELRADAAAAGDAAAPGGPDLGDAGRAALRDRGDAQSHALLMRLLAERFPGDAVLSEEGADDPARLGADRVWIVDPLDGTREYGEP